jgi:hypothetical protein
MCRADAIRAKVIKHLHCRAAAVKELPEQVSFVTVNGSGN